MARIGMKLEPIFWSSFQNSAKGYNEIFRLIDSAILVLALERPDEFLQRRSHIVEFLFKNHSQQQHFPDSEPPKQRQQPKACSRFTDDVSGCLKKQHQRQQERQHRIKIEQQDLLKAAAGERLPLPSVRKIENAKTIMRVQEDSQKISRSLDQEAALKLKATKRKFQDSYRDAHNSRRKVQQIHTQDLPPQRQQTLGFQTKKRRIRRFVAIDHPHVFQF